jgi:hypothetical protein
MMKKILPLFIVCLLLSSTSVYAIERGYVRVAEKGDIVLYAKKRDGGYFSDFKLVVNEYVYSRSLWRNSSNPTYAPKIHYEDITNDGEKEVIIILTTGTGTGIHQQEVYVYRNSNGLMDILVDNPLAIIFKNVKTSLSPERAEVTIGAQKHVVELKPPSSPDIIFSDIAFASIVDYDVKDQQLTVRVGGQISPSRFVGDINIVYEYRDKMLQAKTISFTPYD